MTTLANETGITYNMIKKYCTTSSEPTISNAEKMADVLGVSLDELTGHVSKSKKSMFQEVCEEDMTYIKGFMRNVHRFADKTAVNEETVRLRSHFDQMEAILKKSEPVGRKLDFIAQEMNREANTTLSKTTDLEISNKGIELKTEIEKIREQIQNIE